MHIRTIKKIDFFINITFFTLFVSFSKTMKEKRQSGQPIAFTDLYGLLIGGHLLAVKILLKMYMIN